jgi:hypothetical protein
LPPILDRLQIDPEHWLYLSRNFESRFKTLVGGAHAMRAACHKLGRRWAQGITDGERYFSPPAAS